MNRSRRGSGARGAFGDNMANQLVVKRSMELLIYRSCALSFLKYMMGCYVKGALGAIGTRHAFLSVREGEGRIKKAVALMPDDQRIEEASILTPSNST